MKSPFPWLLALPVAASQIHYEEVTRSQLLASTPAIAVVDAASPATRVVADRFTADRLVVAEVLKDDNGLLRVGTTIEVAPGDLDVMDGVRRLWETEGVSESPIVPVYDLRPTDAPLPSRRVAYLCPRAPSQPSRMSCP